MIKQIKTGITLLGFAHGKGSGIAFSLVMLVLGALFLILMPENWQGNYFLFAVAMWPVQMLYSFSVSDLILSSPQSKKIQTSISALIDFLGYFAIYLIVFVIRLIQMKNGIISESMAGFQMLFSGALSILLFLYLGVALKYFVAGTAAFIVSFMAFVVSIQILNPLVFFEKIQLSFWVASLLGVLFLIASALLQYGVTCLIYRKPVSKRSQLSGLRKNM